MNRKRGLDILTVLCVTSALSVSTLVVGREFFPSRFRSVGPGNDAVAPTRSFSEPGMAERLATTGWRSGEVSGSDGVTIVEFADFQCPACRATSRVISKIVSEERGKVVLAYHHFPIERIHPHSFAAAVAFECAAEQGRGQAMLDELFERQEEIGRTRWPAFAVSSGVPDGVRFDACLREGPAAARVRADAALSRALGLEGTPTLLVGRTVVFGGVGTDSLRALLRGARALTQK